MERGYGAPSQTYPLGTLRLPRIARNRGSHHLPYLEIKLTFECTARFYGLAPPLVAKACSHRVRALCHVLEVLVHTTAQIIAYSVYHDESCLPCRLDYCNAVRAPRGSSDVARQTAESTKQPGKSCLSAKTNQRRQTVVAVSSLDASQGTHIEQAAPHIQSTASGFSDFLLQCIKTLCNSTLAIFSWLFYPALNQQEHFHMIYILK